MPTKTKATAAEKKKKPTKKAPERPKKAASKKAPVKEKARKKQEKEAVLAVDIDKCGIKLTALKYKFIVNYITPGQPCFHNALQSALKAGYSVSAAKANIYTLLQNPDIKRIIKANESLIYQKVHESAVALEIKQRRAFFKPSDYFEIGETTVKNKGGEYQKSTVKLKPISEMTDEQQMCIDGVEAKGQSAVPTYVMPDRGKELNDLIKLDKEYSKAIADDGEEETREIIMERITIREQRRHKDATILDAMEADIVDRPVIKEEM